MKKILIIGGILAVLSMLISLLAIPARAQDPADADASPPGQETWQAMHQSCGDGDWEAMEDAAEAFQGEDLSSMPCHDENPDYQNGEGMMGSQGMMGGSNGSYNSMMW
jgi:hypothetical protein